MCSIDIEMEKLDPLTFREEEETFLIYNYAPFYAGKQPRDWGFQQAYVF